MAGEGFDLAGRITLDASGATAGGEQAASAIDKVSAAQTAAAKSATDLGKATKGAGDQAGLAAKNLGQQSAAVDRLLSSNTANTAATDKATIAAGTLAIAEQRLVLAAQKLAAAQADVADKTGKTTRQQQAATDALSRAQVQFASANLAVERALVSSGKASNDNAHALGGINIGALEAQHAVRGFVDMIIAGQDPVRAFALELPRITQAASFMGDGLGKVGAFLASGWGIATGLAVTAAIPLVLKLFEGADGADKFKEKALSLEDALGKEAVATDAATKAIRDYNAEQAKAIAQDSLASQRALDAGKSRLSEARGTIAALQADIARQRGVSPSITNGIGGNPALAADAALLKEAQTRADALDQTVRNLEIDIGKVGAKNAVDPIARINNQFDKMRDTAIRAATANDKLAGAITPTLTRIEQQRKAALDAEKELDKHTGSTNALSDAQARLQAATTPVARAEAQLALVRAQANIDLKKHIITEDQRTAKIAAAERAVTSAKNATRDLAAANREAAKTEQELGAVLDGLVAKYEPAIAAARKLAAEQADIAYLLKRGPDNGGIDIGEAMVLTYQQNVAQQAEEARRTSEAAAKIWPNAANDFAAIVEDATEKSGRKFRDDATAAGQNFVDAVSQVGGTLNQIVGGRAGSTISRLTSSGGLGGASVLSGLFSSRDPYKGFTPAQLRQYSDEHDGALPIGVGSRTRGSSRQQADLEDSIAKLARGVGISDNAAATIGKYSGKAIQGAAVGALTNSVFAPIAKGLGIKSSQTGATLGGAVGNLIPGLGPFGGILGGLAGSVIGGLFKTVKSGGATISNATGSATLSGNSTSLKGSANSLAGAVQDGLSQIAQQLGGSLGSFGGITIGQYKDRFRVNTVSTKLGGSKKPVAGLEDYATADEAVAAAIRDAIAKGAVQGLDTAVQRALSSNTDIDKAVAEALQVKNVESLIGGIGYTLHDTFATFDATAKSNFILAQKYGLDTVALTKATEQQRAQLISDTLKQSVGSLQGFLDSVRFGDLADGSATDKRAAILDQIGLLQGSAQDGNQASIDQISNLLPQLLSSTKDAFGTASAQYTADKEFTTSTAAKIIAMESDRINSAAAAQQAQTTAIQAVATGVDETNDILARIETAIKSQGISVLSLAAANDATTTAIPSTLLRA